MKNKYFFISLAMLCAQMVNAAEYVVHKVVVDLSKVPIVRADYWQGVEEINLNLMAQMIVKPNSNKAETDKVIVQILHDGKYIAYRLRWKDKEISKSGKLGEFSDAIALEFPVLDNANPPPIFMGAAKNPVHIFHWRAIYEYDKENANKSVKVNCSKSSLEITPNECADSCRVTSSSGDRKKVFTSDIDCVNTQSSPKKTVDEMLAEGFGSSVIIEGNGTVGRGEWKNGEWIVVISRPLNCPNGSKIEVGKSSAFGLAVWQGGLGEVGSRKSITMVWMPFKM